MFFLGIRKFLCCKHAINLFKKFVFDRPEHFSSVLYGFGTA